ncbi:CYH2 protein, partial [Molothrus ater]|nr:CYH2 protein [Molothrus ater]
RELESIRRRKQELLGEIQRLRDELSEAISEVEGLEANEGRNFGGFWEGLDFGNVGLPQGIQFLVEQELLRHTAEDIARFLYKGEGLNKTAIGD